MSIMWDEIRADFPVLKKSIYFDTAGVGPLSRPVEEALQKHYREQSEEAEFAWPRWLEHRENVRKQVADWIGAEPDEIAFTNSTSHGMNLVAELLASQGGVLMPSCEFPASTFPWLWRKASLVWQEPESGCLSLEKTKALLNSEIKTMVTSYVQYATGFRQDLAALGALKKDRFLVVNASQGLGAFPVDVKKMEIDFLVCNSYKWLMAGYGGGILFIRKKWLDQFLPSSLGWRSVEHPDAMHNRTYQLESSARRYELGGPGFASAAAMGAAFQYLSEIGRDAIAARILELTEKLIGELEKAGFSVLSPKDATKRSGIVIVKVDHPKEVWKKLLLERVATAPRGGGLRLALHFYNSMQDIENFIKIFSKVAKF